MSQLLLDHPWQLSESPDSGKFLLDFAELVRSDMPSKVVPFFTEEDYANAWANAKRTTLQPALRFVEQLIRRSDRVCIAEPVLGPNDLSQTWKAALRDAMEETGDWRDPQIVVPCVRREHWPFDHEAIIDLPACEEAPASLGAERLLVTLENYGTHPYARTDIDPWDLQRIHPPPKVGRVIHPCLLPKPPRLRNMSLADIQSSVAHISQEQEGKLFYLPARGWLAHSVTKAAWREKGHGFPHRSSPNRHGSGWIDRENRVWEWDQYERHWDVQSGTDYIRISHTGEKLP